MEPVPEPHAAASVPVLASAVVALAHEALEAVHPEALLERLAREVARVLPGTGVGVVRCRGEALSVAAASSPAVDRLLRRQVLTRTGPVAEAVAAGAPVLLDDLARVGDEHLADLAAELGVRAIAVLPLVGGKRTSGVLVLHRAEPGPWDDVSLAAAGSLAETAATFLVLASEREDATEARRELEYRHLHDELTGLPNRTLLFDRLEHALDVAHRRGHVVAVLFLDLDRFKRINDTYGHAAGDTVLRAVADRMSSAIRMGDTLARLAGDEFVVICEDLPSVTDVRRTVDLVSERLAEAVARPIHFGGTVLRTRASIGSALSTDHDTPDDLLHAADAAMYRSKHARMDDASGHERS